MRFTSISRVAARVLVLDGFVPGPRGAPAVAPALLSWPAKDPADVLDYQFDITPALSGDDGDAVATLDVAISPANPGDLSLASAVADGARAVLLARGRAGWDDLQRDAHDWDAGRADAVAVGAAAGASVGNGAVGFGGAADGVRV